MITMQLFLTLAVLMGVSNCYRDHTNPFNPTVTVKQCDRNKFVVGMENAWEGGIIYILGEGPGCKHRTSESSLDYDFQFDTCKVDLSKMFRVVVQQRSYAQTASDKTIQVICVVDVSAFNSEDNEKNTRKESRSGADGQHTTQPSNTGPIDYSQSKGNEENASAKNAKSPVSADEVGDSLSTWFKVAMDVKFNHPVYKHTLPHGYWKYTTTPVSITTPTTQETFTTTPSAEPTTPPTTKPTTKPTTYTKSTDVTTSATTKMSTTVKVITTTPTTTQPDTSIYKQVTTPMTSTPFMMTTSPKTTKVVGYKLTQPTTTYDRSKKIAYDVLLRNNQYQKTLLLITDFLLQREYSRSPHDPVLKKKNSPIVFLHQLVHQHNHNAGNRPYQLSRNHQPTNAKHKIIQLLKKGHIRTGNVSTSKSQTHRARGHKDTLHLIHKHLRQRGNFNSNSLQRLREHFSKNKHVVGHHRKLVNKHKHKIGYHREHVNKNKQGVGQHQEHINKRTNNIGHHPVKKHTHGFEHKEENGIKEEKKEKHVFEKSTGGINHAQKQKDTQASYLLTNGHDGSTIESNGLPSVNRKGKKEFLKVLMHWFHGH